jgi:hypothetical protein
MSDGCRYRQTEHPDELTGEVVTRSRQTQHTLILCSTAREERALADSAVAHLATIARTGPGPANLRGMLEAVSRDGSDFDVILLAGLAGSLTESHEVGHAWAVRRVTNRTGKYWMPDWPISGSPAARGLTFVDVLDNDEPIVTPAEMREAHREHRAHLVDSGSTMLAEWAHKSRKRWGLVRGAYYGPDRDLEIPLEAWCKDDGSFKRMAMIKAVAKQPWLVQESSRMFKQAATAMQAVIDLLTKLLSD